MDIAELIRHPEQMDHDTLYELRSVVALYPYFQTARLLMLQNLYLLHDPSFDQELRRAAISITDRRVLFQMIEAAHYQPRAAQPAQQAGTPHDRQQRTLTLIDTFLDSMPKDGDDGGAARRRKPTPADAAVDYVAYLMESEARQEPADDTPKLHGQELIDSFINNDKGKIILPDMPPADDTPRPAPEEGAEADEDGIFTETLARIYIKQGRYAKALEIIRRLSLQYPKKNAYFADQIRFLEKLIINSNKKQ